MVERRVRMKVSAVGGLRGGSLPVGSIRCGTGRLSGVASRQSSLSMLAMRIENRVGEPQIQDSYPCVFFFSTKIEGERSSTEFALPGLCSERVLRRVSKTDRNRYLMSSISSVHSAGKSRSFQARLLEGLTSEVLPHITCFSRPVQSS